MNKFLSGYKRRDKNNKNKAGSSEDNEVSSNRETACKNPKCRKYNTKYMSIGFINIDVYGEQRPQCLL
jgi:hypothetical protein